MALMPKEVSGKMYARLPDAAGTPAEGFDLPFTVQFILNFEELSETAAKAQTSMDDFASSIRRSVEGSSSVGWFVK